MNDQVVVMGLSPDEDSRYLVKGSYIKYFKPVLENEFIPKALTNVKFDAHRIMNTAGVDLKGPWLDTVMMDFLYDEDTRENRHGLKPCAKDYFDIDLIDYKHLFGNEDPREFAPGHPRWDAYLDYSSLDPWVTRKLALFLKDKLSKIHIWAAHDQKSLSEGARNYTMLDLYWETEEPQLKVLYRMERRGLLVSEAMLTRIGESLQEEMDGIALELNKLAKMPINPNSGAQVGELLFEKLRYPNEGKTPSGQWKTDKDVLVELAEGPVQSKEAQLILKYRASGKLLGTYAEGLRKWIHTDGRIHTSYSATKTTGRLGSSSPNLQNVSRPGTEPHGIRKAFVPAPGNKLIVGDYGQLELRILSVLAASYGDFTMLNAINDGLDMHSFTAARMDGSTYEEFVAKKSAGDPDAISLRTAAKSVGFGIVYGITKIALSRQLSKGMKRLVSEEEAQGYIDMYLQMFPGVDMYMKENVKFARKYGYVQTLAGRFRRLSGVKSRNRVKRGHAERQAINATVQGSAADIVKRAMIACDSDAYLREVLGFSLLHQVHDELIFEGPEENAKEALGIIQTYMQHPLEEDLPVELEVDPHIVDNWYEGK